MAKVRVNWGSAPDGMSVKLFCVYNASHKHLHVLAPDKEAAMSVAYTANHIYSPYVQHKDQYGRDAYEIGQRDAKQFGDCWHLVEKAIDRRLQGTLHLDDSHLAVGYEIIE